MGLEPTTSGTTTRGYHQLSYGHRARHTIPAALAAPCGASGGVQVAGPESPSEYSALVACCSSSWSST